MTLLTSGMNASWSTQCTRLSAMIPGSTGLRKEGQRLPRHAYRPCRRTNDRYATKEGRRSRRKGKAQETINNHISRYAFCFLFPFFSPIIFLSRNPIPTTKILKGNIQKIFLLLFHQQTTY